MGGIQLVENLSLRGNQLIQATRKMAVKNLCVQLTASCTCDKTAQSIIAAVALKYAKRVLNCASNYVLSNRHCCYCYYYYYSKLQSRTQ